MFVVCKRTISYTCCDKAHALEGKLCLAIEGKFPRRKTLSSYNIFKENDNGKCQAAANYALNH